VTDELADELEAGVGSETPGDSVLPEVVDAEGADARERREAGAVADAVPGGADGGAVAAQCLAAEDEGVAAEAREAPENAARFVRLLG